MKLPLLIIMLLVFGAAQAQDIYRDDINSLLYIKTTFGGYSTPQRDDSLKLGFTVNQSQVGLDSLDGFNLASPDSMHFKLVDIEFSSGSGYFSKFTVGGVDALTYERILHADGSSSDSPNGLSDDRIIFGLILGGALGYGIYMATNDDDDDDGDNNDEPCDPQLDPDCENGPLIN